MINHFLSYKAITGNVNGATGEWETQEMESPSYKFIKQVIFCLKWRVLFQREKVQAYK